jgi:hypothetical protein
MQRYTGLFFDLAHNLFRNFRVPANGGPEYAMTIIRLGVASSFLKCESVIGQFLQDIHTVKNGSGRVNALMPETGATRFRYV